MAFALTERWDEVRILFEGALEQPADARDAWLATHCPQDDLRTEVAALLACHDRPNALLDRGAVGLGAAFETNLPEDYRIGPYRIERLLGRGGMGAVYLAGRSDESFDRQVAIKIIGRSLDSADSLRRFLAERQTLAGLDHPNIARLLDGGATPDRLPYFVMEYVAGEPIDKYCKTHSLDLDARLALFLRVAAAVQHAHEHLIVHRDLKPDNVLVRADGEPKLLDFGIAKTIAPDESPLTTINARAMTPRYASPEQIRGAAIGTSSDIYSLGVLLYEILTGQLPHGGETESGWQVAREITDNEPTAPSVAAEKSPIEKHWAHRLKGDLDAILMMALRKEPERRYRSVDQFADDVRHYLSGRPVIARPDTVGYRARKFVARNRLASAAAALAIVALIGGVVAASWQARVARAAAVRAQAEAARAQRVSEFLKTVIALPDPSWNAAGAGGRNDMTVLDLLKNAGNRIDKELGSDPLMAADLHHAIGNTYRARGLYDDAQPQFARALELRQKALPPNDPKIADSLFYFGANQIWLNHLDIAEQYYEKAIAIERTLPFAQADQLPYMLLDVCSLPSYTADRARAEKAIVEARDLFVRHNGPDHITVAFALQRMSNLRVDAGDFDQADALLSQALAIFEKQHASPLDIAAIQRGQLLIAEHRGDFRGAERIGRLAWAARRAAYGDDSVVTIGDASAVAGALLEQGRDREAEVIVLDSIERLRPQGQAGQPILAGSLISESHIRVRRGDRHVDSLMKEAQALLDIVAKSSPCGAGANRKDLGDVYLLLGRRADAARAFDRALAEVKAGCSPLSETYQRVLQAAPSFGR